MATTKFINIFSFCTFMKKRVREVFVKYKKLVLTLAAILFVGLFILPVSFSSVTGLRAGNVGVIPIRGVIVASESSSVFSQDTVSSRDLVKFIKEADENPLVKIILLEINSPGGSAVASDEVARAVKNAKKPVISLIREVGASGGYWVASASDYVMANRMSVTGSVGVISSYLEFSGLMSKYGVSYERLVAGENKDLGTPYRELTATERGLLQNKLNQIHQFFVDEIVKNRGLSETKVRGIATGEFFLGVEAQELGLIDALGSQPEMEEYLKQKYGLKTITYARYELSPGLLGSLSSVFSNFFFKAGEGLGSMLLKQNNYQLAMV